MARYAMVTDLRKCVACQACTVACNAEWDVPAGHARTRARHTPLSGTWPDLRSSVFVTQCAHCDRPSCVDACPSGASRQSETGVVQIDKDLCIGCAFCVDACPYDARHVDPRTRVADKCTFCAPRVARGEMPVCVATCPAQAKTFGDLEDRGSDVFRLVFAEGAARLETEAVAAGPNVYYLGRPDQLTEVAAAFPPHPPAQPTAAVAFRRVLKPLVLAAVGATFAGQAVAFFNQLHEGEDEREPR